MPNQVAIQSEIELVDAIKQLTQVYQEIAVIRMQKSRNSVLVTREFLEKLLEIFFEVKRSYNHEIELLMKEKPQITKRKKELCVLISANAKLYGDIITKVYKKFVSYIKDHDPDIMIIGRLGRDLYEDQNVGKPYTYFEIPDAEVHMEDLKALISHLMDYSSINVFYGRFETIGVQKADVANITGDIPLDQDKPSKERERVYMFEPDLKTIFEYFEKQTAGSLMKQTVHESQLARYASRIMAMEEAYENISDRSSKLYSERTKVKKRIQNRKQLETLSGLVLWGNQI